MTDIATVLGDFIDAWNAGRRPEVDDHLARVAEADRDELRRQIAMWLQVAPDPEYDEATRAEITADPVLLAALAAGRQTAEPWAARLRAMREQAGLAVEQVAERLAGALGLTGGRQRTADYLARAEAAALDETRVSRRLIDALASVLGVDRDDVAPAWGMPPTAAQFYRREAGLSDAAMLEQEFDALSRAARVPAPEPLDELDRLFLGGPDA